MHVGITLRRQPLRTRASLQRCRNHSTVAGKYLHCATRYSQQQQPYCGRASRQQVCALFVRVEVEHWHVAGHHLLHVLHCGWPLRWLPRTGARRCLLLHDLRRPIGLSVCGNKAVTGDSSVQPSPGWWMCGRTGPQHDAAAAASSALARCSCPATCGTAGGPCCLPEHGLCRVSGASCPPSR